MIFCQRLLEVKFEKGFISGISSITNFNLFHRKCQVNVKLLIGFCMFRNWFFPWILVKKYSQSWQHWHFCQKVQFWISLLITFLHVCTNFTVMSKPDAFLSWNLNYFDLIALTESISAFKNSKTSFKTVFSSNLFFFLW